MTAKKPVSEGGNRRRKGEGSLVWREDRQSWMYQLRGKNGFTVYAPSLEDDEETGEKGLLTKINERRAELKRGIRTQARYTVKQCVSDYLEHRKKDLSPESSRTYGHVAHHLASLHTTPIRDLTPKDVQDVLDDCALRLSTASVKQVRMIMRKSIEWAMFNRLVGDNVAELTNTPQGIPGRPSKAFTLEQAITLLETARSHRLWAYIAVSLLTGVRTEEARVLKWTEVDLKDHVLKVLRADRFGGDTKTASSRRAMETPMLVVTALQEQILRQAADRARAGSAWQEQGNVFTTTIGTVMDPNNLRAEFQDLCELAGLGRNWTPRELRHTFVSVLSEAGVPIEKIADLVGHSTSRTTEAVYRHVLTPVLRGGTDIMDRLFAKLLPGGGAVEECKTSPDVTPDQLKLVLESFDRQTVLSVMSEILTA